MTESDPRHDAGGLSDLLTLVAAQCRTYLESLPQAAVHDGRPDAAAESFGDSLPEVGEGSRAALERLMGEGVAAATRSAGPRFFHFVTGGVTPAALAADWLTSTLDQNSFSWVSSPLGSQLEKICIAWLKDLFRLPLEWGGVITTGATMANFTALAAARRWWAAEHGVDIDNQGFSGLPPMPVLSSGYLHASAVKALGMLGIGRDRVTRLPADETGRLDLAALERTLRARRGQPVLIIANAGEVNTGDFDPIRQTIEVARAHRAWVHVDGAFGLFARVSSLAVHLADGVEAADSVIADGHKWLNVPYDCGFAFVRDPSLMTGVFSLRGPYLPLGDEARPSFGDFGPEASRRARCIPVWATLYAYGRSGHREMIDGHIRLARRLGEQVERAPDFELLAPVRLNVVCFRYRPPGIPEGGLDELNRRLGEAILADGRVYYGTTVYAGRVGFRPAISNWRTGEEDVDLVISVARELGESLAASR